MTTFDERSADDLLDAVIEGLPNMVFVKDAERLAFVRFNRAGEQLLGMPREMLLGKTDYDFFPKEQADFFTAKDRLTLASGVEVDIPEEPIQTARGQRMLHTKKVPLLDATGKPRYLLGISEDITERKSGEDAKARLAAIVESSDDGILSQTLDGIVTSWNSGAERIFGYAGDEVMGRPMEMLFPRDRADEEEQILGRLRRGERLDHFETVRRRKDGRDIDVSVTISPVQDASGKMVGVSTIARDITALKSAQRDIARSKAEADAANRELEAFTYSVAHDLRAPLRSIEGFSQALLEDCAGKLDAGGQAHLQRVCAAAQRMSQLIDDLLKLSRLSRGNLCRDRVDITMLARTIGARMQKEERGARELDFRVQEGMIADGDPALLAIVFENLLGNAWKFTSKRPSARIEVGIVAPEGEPAYYVRDDGAGFDMAYVDKLFGAFQRLHGAHEFPGTGIGLATVQRVVSRHGGRVWAEGQVGRGATFYFSLGAKDQ